VVEYSNSQEDFAFLKEQDVQDLIILEINPFKICYCTFFLLNGKMIGPFKKKWF
jgi:hypothetical protein